MMAYRLGGAMGYACGYAWAYIVLAFTDLLPGTITVFLVGVGIGVLIERKRRVRKMPPGS